jgi:DNA-binding NarL/FixJ family response regulator
MTEKQETKIIKILIADDHAIVRGGLKAIISFEPDMAVVAEAADGVETVSYYQDLRPDIVLMDLLMPNKDGIAAITDIRQIDPEARVIVLTSFTDSDKMLLAVKCGAQGYVLKNSPPEELLQAIRDVYRGAISLQPAIARQLFSSLGEAAENLQPEEILTERELEVLKLIAKGLTNDEIAEQLIISKRTVNVHIGSILSKLHLVNRAQVVLYALRRGLIGIFND